MYSTTKTKTNNRYISIILLFIMKEDKELPPADNFHSGAEDNFKKFLLIISFIIEP